MCCQNVYVSACVYETCDACVERLAIEIKTPMSGAEDLYNSFELENARSNSPRKEKTCKKRAKPMYCTKPVEAKRQNASCETETLGGAAMYLKGNGPLYRHVVTIESNLTHRRAPGGGGGLGG